MCRLRIRELVRKEFIQIFRDKRNRPILIVAPLIQILIFGYVVNFDINIIHVALLDQSRTLESRKIVDAFSANHLFQIDNIVHNSQEMEEILIRGKADIGLKIGPDLARKIRRGETAEVQILADGTVSNMAAIRVSYVMTVMERLNRQFLQDRFPAQLSTAVSTAASAPGTIPTSTAVTSSFPGSSPSSSCSSRFCSPPWQSSRKRRGERWNSSS